MPVTLPDYRKPKYSLSELQHEVGDKLGRSDDEGSRLIERLGVVFDVPDLPHQRGQPSANTPVLVVSQTHTQTAACKQLVLQQVPVEAVHQPLAYRAEVGDVGHHRAVGGVSLQVHGKGERRRHV